MAVMSGSWSCRDQRRRWVSLHVLLGGLVERFALGSAVHEDESGDSELLAGLGNGHHPAGLLDALAILELLLGHHPSAFGQAQILLGHSAFGVHLSAVPHHAHAPCLAFLGHSLRLTNFHCSFWCFGLRGYSGFSRGFAGSTASSPLRASGLGGFAGSDGLDGHCFGVRSKCGLSSKFFQN